jgi:murein DD-endopeptidase MepM/ murein hydrolase activator NlpD
MRPITSNKITQGQHGNFNAVDYSAKPDPIAYAPEDVTFVSYGNNGDCGNNLKVRGASGVHGFCHIEEIYIQPGQTVKAGERLFKMGYTGKTDPVGPNGRHAHQVLNVNGVYIYPLDKINEPFGGNMSNTPDVNGGDAVNVLQGIIPDYVANANDKTAAVNKKDWKKYIYEDVLTHPALKASLKERLQDKIDAQKWRNFIKSVKEG